MSGGFVEKRRVVVQICSSGFPPHDPDDVDGGDWIYALCDDGSVWTRPGTVSEDSWQRLPDIPQGDED